MKYIILIALLRFVHGSLDVDTNIELLSATPTPVDDILTTPYCFRFTWLGPKYNSDSQFKNASCDDVRKKSTGVPCTLPLVVTNNSNVPDTTYMWNEYNTKPLSVACRLVRGEVCAKFSYIYNNAIENITYMCTKVNIESEGAVTSGCYKEEHSGREVEVCVCESSAGRMPCNVGNIIVDNVQHVFILFILFIIIEMINFR